MIAGANFTYLIGISLPSVAVWLLRRDHPDWGRPWRAPRGTVTLGLFAAGAWLAATLLGFRQFSLPVVIFGLLLAYSGCVLFAWRRYTDRRAAGLPPIPRSLHLKLTGAMLAVMVLDGSGYLLAVSSTGRRSPVMVAVLEDIFVAVAIVTISVGLVLPGMIAHSVTQVAAAAKRLSAETLLQLTSAMEALGRGNLDEARVSPDVMPVEVISRDEVGAMAVAFNGMQRSVADAARALDSARLALRKSRGDLEYLATHDSLTALPNRRHIEMEIRRIVDDCAARNRDCAVVAIDLDGFKFINDSRGHAAGDSVLRAVAGLFRRYLRQDDFIGRLGGDEFAAVLPDTTPDDAQAVMVELLAALSAEPIVLDDGHTVRVTASAGLASLCRERPPTAQELLIQADVAMYQAKDTGRDRIARYSMLDPQQADVMLRHTWVERIVEALANDKFVLLVQPLMNLATNEVDHYEALLRMVDDDGSLIAPGSFLPAAERSGLIKRIDRWVIGAACRMLATEQIAGHRIHLAVNLSGTSMSDPDIGEVIESAVAGLPKPEGMIIRGHRDGRDHRHPRERRRSRPGWRTSAASSRSTTSAPVSAPSTTSSTCRSTISRSTATSSAGCSTDRTDQLLARDRCRSRAGSARRRSPNSWKTPRRSSSCGSSASTTPRAITSGGPGPCRPIPTTGPGRTATAAGAGRGWATGVPPRGAPGFATRTSPAPFINT